MNKMEPKKLYYPACVIAFLIALLFGIFAICQVYLLKDTYPVSKLWVGSDYVFFYGTSPYRMGKNELICS